MREPTQYHHDRLGNELHPGDQVALVYDGATTTAEVVELIDEHAPSGEHVHLRLKVLDTITVPGTRVTRTSVAGPSKKPPTTPHEPTKPTHHTAKAEKGTK